MIYIYISYYNYHTYYCTVYYYHHHPMILLRTAQCDGGSSYSAKVVGGETHQLNQLHALHGHNTKKPHAIFEHSLTCEQELEPLLEVH